MELGTAADAIRIFRQLSTADDAANALSRVRGLVSPTLSGTQTVVFPSLQVRPE